jgi:hypothetical protein
VTPLAALQLRFTSADVAIAPLAAPVHLRELSVIWHGWSRLPPDEFLRLADLPRPMQALHFEWGDFE